MGNKENLNNSSKIEESIHYDDSLVKGSEIANEARIGFTNPSSELLGNEISPVSGNTTSEVNVKKSQASPKVKTQNIVNVLLIGAAATGSTVLGTTVFLISPSVTVSLFSRTSDSLTFQVDRMNIGEDDRLVASLFYEEEEMAYDIFNIMEEEAIREKYVTYGNLLEETTYVFKVFHYPNFNAVDSEGNSLYDETVEPKVLYSSSFVTANYSDEVGIEMDPEYNHDELSFTIYNRTNLPFVSVRLITETNKELFVKDTNEQEITFTVNNLPYDVDMYITIKYGDRGLAYLKVDAIPSEEEEVPPDPETLTISYNQDSSHISYNKMELNFIISDYTKGESLTAYINDELMMSSCSSEPISDANEGEFFVFADNLEPKTLYHIVIMDENKKIIYSGDHSTDYLAEVITPSNREIFVNLHPDFVNLATSGTDNYYYLIKDKDSEIIASNDVVEVHNSHPELELYGQETYTFDLIKASGDTSQSGEEVEVIYTLTFEVDADLRPVFFIEENVDLYVGYDYMVLWYNISDIEQINNMKFYLDGELCTIEEYDEEYSSFTYVTPIYDEFESTHKVDIYDANDTLIFTNSYTLLPIVTVQPDSDLTMFQLDWNTEFLNSADNEYNQGINYSFEITNKYGSVVCADELMHYNGSSMLQSCSVPFIYDGDYTITIYKSSDEETGSTKFFEKTFTVSGAKTSPVISTSIEDTVLTLTLNGGEMPQGLEDGTRYLIEIHSDDTGYDELTYFNYSLDEETILIFNLQNGGIGGDPGSNNHDDATTGTYTFQLSCDGVVFYRGSFNIS